MLQNRSLRRLAMITAGLLFCLAVSTWGVMPDYVPGQIIVKFAPQVGKIDVRQADGVISVGILSLDQRMAKYGVDRIGQIFPHKRTELGDIYQFDFDDQFDAMAVAGDFSRDQNLLYAEPRYIQQIFEQPNDPSYVSGVQWYIDTVRCPEAWDLIHGDSTVIIAIVDTGVDWDHPDMAENIWVNPGEDINGDGKITAIDVNSADDDSNGYIDDFVGWDFGSTGAGYQDNNPNEWSAVHGTHVAGIAAAVTNNDLGVAGVSWNCSIMPVKAVRDGQDGIRFGYEGIQYAADNGAAVINTSWGHFGGGPSMFEQEVIDSTFAKGVIFISSAGNDPGVTPPDTCPIEYPAWYNHVIGVAATDINDRATSWTFYGSWVDVAAPGQGIYNIWYDDSYAMLQGTSMSSPLVAGVAGLLRTIDPDMDGDEFEAKMWHTSDDIYDTNPRYVGWLGGGRVNVHAAVLSMTEPRLVLDPEWTIDDAGGNGDGRADPGETVDWIVTLINTPTWQLAQNVRVDVSALDPDISFVISSVELGDIEPGMIADNSSQPIQFSVETGAQAHWVTFYLQIQSGEKAYSVTDSVQMMIGRPDVLLVDDDDGDDIEKNYQRDLDFLSVVYDLWEVAEQGKVGPGELGRYNAVIWLTGVEGESTLTVSDQDHLSDYLDDGHYLFLSGQNIGDEIGASSFFSDYLHAAHNLDTVAWSPPVLYGLADGVIAGQDSLFLQGQSSASSLSPLTGAAAVYGYTPVKTEGNAAAVRYESSKGSKVVYFAFGYEGIRAAGSYTAPWVVLDHILQWFEVETNPTSVDVETGDSMPGRFVLLQNYPNPFNAETSIDYTLPEGAQLQRTTVNIYNILGQQVRSLVNGLQRAGAHTVRWDGRDSRGLEVSTGVYFCRLGSGDLASTKKMVLLR